MLSSDETMQFLNQIRRQLQGAEAVIDRRPCQNPKRSQSRTSQTDAEPPQQRLSTPGHEESNLLCPHTQAQQQLPSVHSAPHTTGAVVAVCCCRNCCQQACSYSDHADAHTNKIHTAHSSSTLCSVFQNTVKHLSKASDVQQHSQSGRVRAFV
jgi:hypothetical protein